MSETRVPPTAVSSDGAAQLDRESYPTAFPPAPEVPLRWTAGRVTSLVVGGLLTFMSLVLLGSGGTALWVDLAKRDAAGYLTTDVREFTTSGSALVTVPTELGSAGFGWFYPPGMLDKIRIRVTPSTTSSTLFVGIGPTTDVDRYLAGVPRTVISEFFRGEAVRTVDGDARASAPGAQDFWVASDSGSGPRTLGWDPTDGSWTVVVMNIDGRPGIDGVKADLGATVPSLVWIALGVFFGGAIFLAGGVLLILGATRRRRTT
jgi:hypothetical protein